MYDFAGESFDKMTVAELRTYLSQPEVSKYAAKWNTKTTKPALLAIAYGAHHAFHASGDADRLREEMLSAQIKKGEIETEREIEELRNDDSRVADMMTPPAEKIPPGLYVGQVTDVDFKGMFGRITMTIDDFAGQFVMFQNMWVERSLLPTRKRKLNKRGKRHARFSR